MRLTTTLILFVAMVLAAACSMQSGDKAAAPAAQRRSESVQDVAPAAVPNAAPAGREAKGGAAENQAAKPVSLDEAGKAKADTAVTQRKIIRNAELLLQSDQPEDGLRRITAAAEAKGGFVVNSETTQRGEVAGRTIKITARVPSSDFEAFLAEVRNVGARVLSERITGQDVTEEFVDLEARLRVQKETEARYLEFLKQAKGVDEALTVQRELSNVRTVIEQLEGRRRFLESQSSLSTVTVTLQSDTNIVASPKGFWYDVKKAFSEGVELAANIVLFLIRMVLVLLPLTLFVFAPLFLAGRFVWRRVRRNMAGASKSGE